MRLLILGGTVFVGRALVEAGLQRGHEITLFNRGQSNPDLYPEVEQLHGNRDGGLQLLLGRRWDAVIDTCGYVPRVVRQSAELLAPYVGSYCFISTISVYASLAPVGVTEEAAVGTLADETVEEITGETYGPLKALCEAAVAEALGQERTLIIRPGLIVGPHDVSDRFPYWVARIAEGGEVLAPGQPEQPVQIVDVYDLANFTLDAVERGVAGVFHVTGRPRPMGELLEIIREISGSDAVFTWVDEDFLLAQGVEPFSHLPLWLPAGNEDYAGFMRVDCHKAEAAGLRPRPLSETVQQTLAWVRGRPSEHKWRAGLSRTREAELLKLWHRRSEEAE